MGIGWTPLTPFTSDEQPYVPYMSDAHMGVWVMLVAVIGIGALYGFQLHKYGSWRPLRFRLPLRAFVFVFYFGALMPVSSQLLVGPYAYFGYATNTLVLGIASAAIATFVCGILFRLLEISHDVLSKILRIFRNVLSEILNVGVERLYGFLDRYRRKKIAAKGGLSLCPPAEKMKDAG